jgi:hypothetical protein
MPKTLLDLAKTMNGMQARLKAESSRASIAAAEVILSDLVWKTPVDTSQALSNWQVRLSKPVGIRHYLEPHYPGQKGSTQRDSALETIALGKEILKQKKPGQKIFISNVAPYIVKLNDGYSRQEPAGFVERARMLGEKTVRKFKLKLKG